MDIVIGYILIGLLVLLNWQAYINGRPKQRRPKERITPTTWTGQTKTEYEQNVKLRKPGVIVMNQEHEEKALNGFNVERW